MGAAIRTGLRAGHRRYLIKETPNVSFDMAPMPKGKTGAFTRAPSDCMTLGSQTKHRDAALEFASHLTGADGLKPMDLKAGLGIPPLRSPEHYFVHAKVKGLENPNWQVVLNVEAKQHAKLQDVTIKWPEMDKTIGAEHDQLLAGKEMAKGFATKLDPITPDQRGFPGD